MYININQEKFEVIIEHKAINNMYLRVLDNNTLKITCNKYVNDITIISFLNRKAKWIIKTRDKLIDIRKNNTTGIINNNIFYYGKPYNILLIYSNNYSYKIIDNTICIYLKNKFDLDIVTLNERLIYDEDIKQHILKIFYKLSQKNLGILVDELRIRWDAVIQEYNLQTPIIEYKTLKNAWGYCKSAKSYIVLNHSLIHKEIEFIDQVLWHEYCHLVIPNHSKRFYSLFSKYKPNSII